MVTNPFTSLPDPELIEACLNGKNQAWEVLLTRYQRLVYSIPLRYGLTEHDANDVFQNVSLLLLENLHSLRNRQRLGAWLAITTRRECWRMNRHQRQLTLAQETASVNEQAIQKGPSEENLLDLERQSIIQAALRLLGSPCQQLLTLLFYTEPRPAYTEVARKLSIPEGSIGPNRARCLEKMLKILEEMGFSEM
ncbi:MAG TPA: sigma-70 family RNA polymerase sigma factor [Anaerolineales bacterium]|nr:sigma-70 family RNA polymerase sigma factor [Anaerolineales bacterium]